MPERQASTRERNRSTAKAKGHACAEEGTHKVGKQLQTHFSGDGGSLESEGGAQGGEGWCAGAKAKGSRRVERSVGGKGDGL